MKPQSLALAILASTTLLLGVSTCNKATNRHQMESSMERCRVNKVVLIDEYQENRSVYPTRLKWILETDEGYRVISYDGNYRIGDSINIEVRRLKYNKRNK